MYINTLLSNGWKQRDAEPIVKREPVRDRPLEVAFDGGVDDMFRERRALQIKEPCSADSHFRIVDRVW